MEKTAFEMAQQYYPKYWSKSRLITLVRKGKLTPEEYEQVTGEVYAE